MRQRLSLLLALPALLVAPAGAGAATVQLAPVQFCVESFSDCRYMSYQDGVVLRYDGEGAEANRLLVRREGDSVLLTDAGATLRPGRGCAVLDAHTASCAVTPLPLVGYRLDGHDGDDLVAIAAAGLAPRSAVAEPRLLLGGAGADALVDGADGSTLMGGPGADRLTGNGGDDRFFDAAYSSLAQGSDRDDGASDIADGGAGADTADYHARRGDLELSLAGPQPGGGEPGERDSLQGIEVVLGGRGDDRIAGSAARERLEGNGGNDRLRGGAGDDVLVGGAGRDDLRGGRGDDRIGAGAGRGDGDRVECGTGRDVVGELLPDDFLGDTWRGPDAVDVVALDCEGVSFGSQLDLTRDIRVDPRPRRAGRTWSFANPCVEAGDGPCRGRLDLGLAGGRLIARSRFQATGGRVTLRLSRREARAVARAQRVTLHVTAAQTRRLGARRDVAFALSLARPR